MADWKHSPKVITMTVRQVRDFLDSELAKYKTWEEFNMSHSVMTHILKNAKSFSNVKREGVGERTVLKFLGKPWKQWLSGSTARK